MQNWNTIPQRVSVSLKALLVMLPIFLMGTVGFAQISTYTVTNNGGNNTTGSLNYAVSHLYQWQYTGTNGSVVLKPDTSLYDPSLKAYVVRVTDPLLPISLYGLTISVHSSKKYPVIIDFGGQEGFTFTRSGNVIQGPYRFYRGRRPGLILRNFKNFAIRVSGINTLDCVADISIWASKGANGIECVNSGALISRVSIVADSLASSSDQYGGIGILSNNPDHNYLSTYEVFGATGLVNSANGDMMHPGVSASIGCKIDSSFIGFNPGTKQSSYFQKCVDHIGIGRMQLLNSVIARGAQYSVGITGASRADINGNHIGVYYDRLLAPSNPFFPSVTLSEVGSLGTGVLYGPENGQILLLNNYIGGFDKAVHIGYGLVGTNKNGTRIGPGLGGTTIANQAGAIASSCIIGGNIIGGDKASPTSSSLLAYSNNVGVLVDSLATSVIPQFIFTTIGPISGTSTSNTICNNLVAGVMVRNKQSVSYTGGFMYNNGKNISNDFSALSLDYTKRPAPPVVTIMQAYPAGSAYSAPGRRAYQVKIKARRGHRVNIYEGAAAGRVDGFVTGFTMPGTPVGLLDSITISTNFGYLYVTGTANYISQSDANYRGTISEFSDPINLATICPAPSFVSGTGSTFSIRQGSTQNGTAIAGGILSVCSKASLSLIHNDVITTYDKYWWSIYYKGDSIAGRVVVGSTGEFALSTAYPIDLNSLASRLPWNWDTLVVKVKLDPYFRDSIHGCYQYASIKLVNAGPALAPSAAWTVSPTCYQKNDGRIALLALGTTRWKLYQGDAPATPSLADTDTIPCTWTKRSGPTGKPDTLIIDGLTSSTYGVVAWGASGGACLPAKSRISLIAQEAPTILLTCAPRLRCRRAQTDSVALSFQLTYSAITRLATPSLSPYESLAFEGLLVDGKDKIRGTVKIAGSLGSLTDMVLWVPTRLLAAGRSYQMLVTAFGDSCRITGCKKWVPLCDASNEVRLETPGPALEVAASTPGPELGEQRLLICPTESTYDASIKALWRPFACDGSIPDTVEIWRVALTTNDAWASAPTRILQYIPASGETEHSVSSSFSTTASFNAPDRYRLIVRMAGCADSLNLSVRRADTSRRVITGPTSCNPNGGALNVFLGDPSAHFQYWATRSLTSTDTGIYSEAQAIPRAPLGGYFLRAYVQEADGGRSCPVNPWLGALVAPGMPSGLTISNLYSPMGRRECAIKAKLGWAGQSTAQIGDLLSTSFRLEWIHKENVLHDVVDGDHIVDLVPYNDTIRDIHYRIPFVASTADSAKLIDTLLAPTDGATYTLRIYNTLTGCYATSSSLTYTKPVATRKFTLCVAWPESAPIPADTTPIPTQAAQNSLTLAFQEGRAACRSRLAEVREAINNGLLKSPAGVRDSMKLAWATPIRQFTLYYYDAAGRLVATVPPHGVKFGKPDEHTLVTRYTYNSLGERVASVMPDAEGREIALYDRKGLVRFSRNAADSVAGQFRYVLYDSRNRVTETGLATGAFPTSDDIDDGFVPTTASRVERILSSWDIPLLPGQTFTQDRVVMRRRIQPALSGTGSDTVTQWYAYDIAGRVYRDWQLLPGLDTLESRYRFEPVSGKMLERWLMAGPRKVFGERYGYDDDGRLLTLETSTDSIHWEAEARQSYYAHGPLKRQELGSEKVQGLDYAYTAQGWLKSINGARADTTSDMGRDGRDGSAFARDEFATTLHFYNGDYSTNAPTGVMEAALPGQNHRYGGNIAAWSRHTPSLSDTAQAELYQYDILQRLRSAGGLRKPGSGSWAAGNGYASTYAYDKGGNLLTLTRRNTQGSVIDNLSYAYPRNTDGSLRSNRLRAVSDAATAQGLEAGRHNFGYDALGRLTTDSLQNLTLAWTLDSKPRAATTGSTTTRYLYDSDGNRIARKTSRSGATADTTWLYLRSGDGAELALLYRIHRADSTLITLQEATIGSAKRLGLYRSPTLLAKSVAATARPAYLATTTTDTVRTSGRYPGYRSYQLEDHLGNVRVVVGDNKAADTSSGGLYLASRVLSATEYFPFGMTARQQTGSVAWAGGKYRWGFNGKELDRALGSKDAQDYGFRAYRPEIARFMSVDPLREKYPELTTYQFAGNTPIEAVDLDGLEPGEPGDRAAKASSTLVSPESKKAQDNAEGSKEYRSAGTGALVTGAAAATAAVAPSAGIAFVRWALSNPVAASNAGAFAVGLVDENPVGTVDLPGPADDAGRAARQAAKLAAREALSPDAQKVLATIDALKSQGGRVQVNRLDPANLQELNLTVHAADASRVDIRIETHGHKGGAPRRHLNADVYNSNGNRVKMKHIDKGHKFLD